MKRLYLRTWQSLKLRQLIVRLRKENSQIIIWEVSIGERWDKVGEKENKVISNLFCLKQRNFIQEVFHAVEFPLISNCSAR